MAIAKVGACWCVHDDSAYLGLSLQSFSQIKDRIVFVSKCAWHGNPGDWEGAAAIAEENGAEVVLGEWNGESEHRHAALEYVQKESQDWDFALIPDGDEVIQQSLLDELLKLASVDAADSVRCRMLTYWKSPKYVIRPAEELAPLIMLKCANARHVHIREYDAGPRTLTLNPSFGNLLHLSYCGSDARIERKINTWGHRLEVGKEWFNQVWKGWDSDRSMHDLHPTHPHCYGFAERIPVTPELIRTPDSRGYFADPEIPKKWPKVSIVIPLHGGEEILRNCLESLQRAKDLIHEVVVVDDVSPDGAAAVAEGFEGVTLIRNERNLGFGATCNRGYDVTTGEIVVFLNSDTVVPRAGLIRLIGTLMSSRTVGAAGPFSNHAGYHQAARSTYTSLDNLDLFAQDFAHRAVHDLEVNMLVGFCIAVWSTAFEEVDKFDERFGIGMFEDNDLCYKLLRAGYTLKVAARAFVHHEGSKSLMLRKEHPIRLLERNREIFVNKWKHDLELGFASHLSGFSADKIVFNSERSPDRVAEDLASKAELADISLCMIVRNEERVLRDCLASAKPFFKQMIVVDTGSTDCTVEIATELGAEVHHFPWVDSFSAARNESLKHATGKWIFWMDADDTLPYACGEHLLDVVLNSKEGVIGYVVPVHFVGEAAGGTRVDHVKLFRNLPGVKFEFRIHEQNLMSLNTLGGEIMRSNAYVLHSGYDTSPAGQARKRERDYRLLNLDIEEQGEHPFILFNCGMTDHFTGAHETAIDWLERSIVASNGQGSQLRKTYALLAGSLRELGRHEEALSTVYAGLEAVGEDPELRFQAGILLANAGRFEEAKEQYMLMNFDIGGHFTSVNVGIFGALREHNLGIACHGLGDYGGARTWLLKALEHRPLHMDSLNALWVTALEMSDFKTLQVLLEIVRTTVGQNDLWAGLGAAYAQAVEGDGGPERFLNQAVAQNGQASAVRMHLARLFLSQGRVHEAYPHLLILTENGVAEAFNVLSVIATRQERYREALSYAEQAEGLEPDHPIYSKSADSLRKMVESNQY